MRSDVKKKKIAKWNGNVLKLMWIFLSSWDEKKHYYIRRFFKSKDISILNWVDYGHDIHIKAMFN